MTTRLAITLLLPLTASAQLTLVSFDGTVESPVTSVYDFGKVTTGDAKEVRFRARNAGTSATVLTTLTLSGTGFTKIGAPSLPVSIVAGNFLEFVVRFSAGSPTSYTANLQVNTISVTFTAAAVQAPFTLVSFDGTVESPVASVYDFGRVAAGDTKDVRFRARNGGNSGVVLTTLNVSGAGFTKVGEPSLPYTIAPGNFLDFVVRFSAALPASYSASLQVNNVSVIILASSVAGPTLTVAPTCTQADSIDFGRIQRGLSRSCTFSLQNSNPQSLMVSTLTVAGSAFQGAQNLRMPLTIAAGDSVTFSVTFTPTLATTYSGTLAVDTQVTQVFRLSGGGFDPPLPTPTLQFDSTNSASNQQRTLTMRLSEASPVTVSGLVTLAFTPSATGIASDTSVMFLATGSRKVAFSVKQGDMAISLGGQSGALFQTGTTSGAITFTLSGTPIAGDPSTTLTIAPASISIDSAIATRRVNDLDIQVTGFDNTYTAGAMSFTFYDSTGKTIGPGAINADFTSSFRTFFSSGQSGSSFLMRVTFPVTGDAKQVTAVDVSLTNSAGTARTQRLTFQ